MAAIKIPVLREKPDIVVRVPGSKSISNRALLMAALSESGCTLKGVLFSDDSRHFISSLQSLGYICDIDEEEYTVSVKRDSESLIPKSEASINVGSAGTAARFLTCMLGMSAGKYRIECSDQMKKRPMSELLDLLKDIGADINYLEEIGHLPIEITGAGCNQDNGNRFEDAELTISIDISRSTQYLSALLMISPILNRDVTITVSSEKKYGSYIGITLKMMKDFGVEVESDITNGIYRIRKGSAYTIKEYEVEADMSAAAYFYALAQIHGGSCLVKGIYSDNMQGDLKFLYALEKLGASLEDCADGIRLTGPKDGIYDGIKIDMNDFSDQAITMAVVAAFAKSDTTIEHIGHIRGQESDRLSGIACELKRLGLDVEEREDSITIHPGPMHEALIETYDDHRMAMGFSLVGTKVEGVMIDNYQCCAKTFENYFDVLLSLLWN